MYIKVENNLVVSGSFALPTKYKLPDGRVTNGLKDYSEAELLAIGIYPLVDVTPEFESAYYDYVSTAYIITATNVEQTNTYVLRGLAIYKAQRSKQIHAIAASKLSAQAEDYSHVEVADWPFLRVEVEQYGVDATIGPFMQEAIDTSGFDAAGLAVFIGNLASLRLAIKTNRYNLLAALVVAADHAAVELVDINSGW